MYNSFRDRNLIEINTKQAIDVIYPQYTVIVGSKADGRTFKMDIGRVCYTDRDEHSTYNRHKTKRYTTCQVKESSLSIERSKWLKIYLIDISQRGWRDESLRSTLSALKIFFDFCDFKGSKPRDLDSLVSNYKYYQINLYHRSRLTGKKSLSASTVYSNLNVARDFIKIVFELSDIEMLNIIPKQRYRGNYTKERKHSQEDFKVFLQTCITCFNEFSKAILDNIYPIPVTLPSHPSSKDYYWTSPSSLGVRIIPNCFNSKNELLTFDKTKSILEPYFKNKSSIKKFYENTLIISRNNWNNEILEYKKIYAYNLCTYCFYYIFLSFTASNIQPTLDLKISDLDLEKIGSSNFSTKHKYRAGRKVDFSASPQLKRYLIKYLKLREKIDSYGFSEGCEYLFVRIGEKGQLLRFSSNSTSTINRESLLFKGVKRISARDIRNLCSEYFIKHSKGNLSLVAKKLNNSLTTVAKSYTSIDIDSQAIEMNEYHNKMSAAILKFGRTNNQPVPINTSDDYDTLEIPTGSCSNLSNYDPVKAIGFSEEALNPSCATFESCLFCEFFAVHRNFEDIHKLLSLREALLKSSAIRNDPEHHLISIEPSLDRISEIIDILQKGGDSIKELINDVEQHINVQIYNEYWSKHIDFLTTASQYKEG